MPLRTLMFGWEYPPAHCGGLGVACQGIVQGLAQLGVDVTLVLPHDASSEEGVAVLSPTAEQRAALLLKIPSGLRPYDGSLSYAARLSESSAPGMDALYGENLLEEVERFTAVAVDLTRQVEADIVHTHDWMTIEAGLAAARLHDRPLVAHVHATELDRTEFHPHQWIYDRERSGLLQADHVIAVSNYTKQLLIGEYGIPGDRISVLHNGTSSARTQFAVEPKQATRPLVLFLGRLTVQKGPIHFLRAAQRVAQVNPSVRFVVAGEGYLLPELVGLSCALGLQDRVMFAGRVSDAEARELYRGADCFVMPSVSEPFGLVALEAITHGAPVVLSKQSGASEVVRNALCVDFWDTEKMADCILTVLRERPLRDQMRSETPRILSNLTWRRQAKRILSIYEKLSIEH